MAVKVLYCVFLAALIVLFVAWAVAALYPTPQWDSEYPGIAEWESSPPGLAAWESSSYSLRMEEFQLLSPAEKKAKLQEYEASRKEYEARKKQRQELREALEKKTEDHGRNVSLASLLVAVVVVLLGFGLASSLPVISEGLLLGGLFTLMYSIGWSFVGSPKTAVIPVGIGLIITVALGYRMFVRTTKS